MQNVIPQGWIKCLLSEYAKIVGGGTPSTKNDQYWSGTIPWITSADIVDVNTIKPKRFITKDAISNSVTSLIPKNNVIFVSRVGLGKVAINRFPLCISQDSQGIIFDKNVFNLVYLANCLSMLAQKFVHQNQGTAIKGILKDDLATLEILCPPLLEQKLIAEIISTWDRAIETLGNLIDAKSNRFSWLLKTLTMPPSGRHGWKKILLGDIGEIIKGKGIMRKDIVEKGIPCIRYADLYTKYDFVVREIDSFVAAKAASSAQLLQKGDIIFAGSGETAGEIGKCAAYLGEYDHVVVGGDTLILRQKNCDSNYLAYALNSSAVNKQKSVLGHGHSVVHLYGKDLKKIYLSLPQANQQKKNAALLNLAKHEIDLLKQLSEICSKQKHGLMQKLLTGKIRVKVTK